MSYTVYGLYDPAQPRKTKYIGRTGVNAKKRLQDHISQTKFRKKHGQKMPAVMLWIDELLSEGRRPEVKEIATGMTNLEAMRLEAKLVTASRNLENDVMGTFNSGRPLGSKDNAIGIQRKKIARQKVMPLIKKLLEEHRAGVREKLGYPHPKLPMCHQLNIDYHRQRHGKPPKITPQEAIANAKRKFIEKTHKWKEALGFPVPSLQVNAPENYEWFVKLKKENKFVKFREWNAGN